MSSRTGSWLIISYIHDISKIKKLYPILISPVDRRRRLLIYPWLDFQLDYSAVFISNIKKLDPILLSPVDRRRRLLIFPWLDFQLDYSALYSIDWFNSDWFFTWGLRFLTLCVSQLETLTMAAIRVTRTIFFLFCCCLPLFLFSLRYSSHLSLFLCTCFSSNSFAAVTQTARFCFFFVVVVFVFVCLFCSSVPSSHPSPSLNLFI